MKSFVLNVTLLWILRGKKYMKVVFLHIQPFRFFVKVKQSSFGIILLLPLPNRPENFLCQESDLGMILKFGHGSNTGYEENGSTLDSILVFPKIPQPPPIFDVR